MENLSKNKRPYKQYLEPSSSKCLVPRETEWRWRKKFAPLNDERKSQDHQNGISVPVPDDGSAEEAFPNLHDTEIKINASTTINETSLSSDGSDDTDDSIIGEETYFNLENTAEKNPHGVVNNADSKEFMFPDAKLTKTDVLTMVFGLSMRHKLSNEARNDILNMLKVCANIRDNSFSTSTYTMSKTFDPPEEAIKYIFYCKTCKQQITDPMLKSDVKKIEVDCPNETCKTKNGISLLHENFFISIDISHQIKAILSEKIFFNRLTIFENNNLSKITDVHDGEMYKQLKYKVNFDLTYNFNTDGAPVFASSYMSMWPIQLIINELSPIDRFKRLIFAGIWVGKKEPNNHLMNTIFKVFAVEAKKLLEKGIDIINPNNGLNQNFKLLPLFCCVDSVARPVMQNRLQFNGFYGCSWCYQPGETVSKHVKYPYVRDTKYVLRTAESHLQDVRKSAQSSFTERVRGVEGPSTLLLLPNFDIIWSCPPDYMHGVLLGCVRQLWDLWVTYKPDFKKYYIGKPDTLKKINDRLLEIKPCKDMQRLPRTIKEKAKWKATEWKYWLLYYSIPCLTEILNHEYLEHFALLVTSIFLLLQPEILPEHLQEAENKLNTLVLKMESLYGKSSMTFNIHSLLHLTTSVRKTGPLWATSTFPFESGIFRIKQQVKGPVGVIKQITKKIYKLNTFLNDVNNTENTDINEKCKSFCNSLFTKQSLRITSTEHIHFLGPASIVPPADEEKYCNLNKDYTAKNNWYFKRCMFNGILYHTKDYCQYLKSHDNVVETVSGIFVEITKLILGERNKFMYVQEIVTEQVKCGNVKLKHMYKVVNKSNYMLLPIEQIRNKCVLIEVDRFKCYLCKHSNNFEI